MHIDLLRYLRCHLVLFNVGELVRGTSILATNVQNILVSVLVWIGPKISRLKVLKQRGPTFANSLPKPKPNPKPNLKLILLCLMGTENNSGEGREVNPLFASFSLKGLC